MKKSLNCRGTLLELSTPVVMGVLNLTPDSFSDGGKFTTEKKIVDHVRQMQIEGAMIIDIGGQSTRPGSTLIRSQEEWQRIGSIIPLLVKTFPEVIFSIDTFYADVAERAVHYGVSIVNDISGGTMDSQMFDVIANLNVPYILTHIQGTPLNMQENPVYKNVTSEILDFFLEKIHVLRSKGVKDVIVDAGFGFGKTIDHNFELLRNLELFKMLDCPLLAGLSRKSMVTRVLDVKAEDALNGTTVVNTLALRNGASILRVHDVKEAIEAIKIFNRYCS